MIRVGNVGGSIRSDVEVTAEPSAEFGYAFESSTSPLYDDAIRTQIEMLADAFGRPPCHLTCLDSGALPFTWQARLTTALRRFAGLANPRPEVANPTARPLVMCRTRLYLPGNSPKLFPNAALAKPDAIILDLEESVTAAKKEEALDLVLEGLMALDWGTTHRMVRINEGDVGLHEVRTLARSRVDTFVVPKVEDPQQVQNLANALDHHGGSQQLILLIESARGVEHAFQLATAHPRVVALSLGLEDYLADLGAVRTSAQSESEYARSRILNAARAGGVMPLASVFPGFEDEAQLANYVRTARAQGYEGVGCIHPSQIAVVHQCFQPSTDEVAHAQEVIRVYESAVSTGLGVSSASGSMVDAPTYRRAQRVLLRAREVIACP